VDVDAELPLDDPQRLVAISVQLSGGVIVVEDETLTAVDLLSGQENSRAV
jgi:hypothetical protein